jgi:hypothetical protein
MNRPRHEPSPACHRTAAAEDPEVVQAALAPNGKIGKSGDSQVDRSRDQSRKRITRATCVS